MLRIIPNRSLAQAKSYYSTADYYAEGQELRGRWRGLGAEQLGLEGLVDQNDWDLLCDNKRPADGEPLTLRQKANRRIGWDVNFHAPKSLSLLYGLTEDSRLLEVFQGAVDSTMTEMEAEAKTRIRKSGANEDRTTGNLAWGEFIHLTARPEDGVPDPHLHAHCFVFNATYDSDEKRWKALQIGDLKRDAPYFEAVFHSKLARGLEELGLETVRTKHGWEIDGLEQETLAAFSRRTARIEQVAKERGVTDSAAKAELGATTRSRKMSQLTMGELQSLWRSRLDDQESDSLDRLADRIGARPIEEDRSAAIAAVSRTMEHSFERSSVIPERTLLTEALRQGAGKASRSTIEALVAEQPLIRGERHGRSLVTTAEAVQEEAAMLEIARSGRGQACPIGHNGHFTRDWLNGEQKAAVRHVLESRDRVMMIRGAAGVGKTSALSELREQAEAAGTPVVAVAPSADASRGSLREEGFESADTVARLLLDEKMQQQARGSLILVDEAGLLGTKSMRSVLELANRIDSRVVLIGDTRQHASVERGSALRQLENAGIKPAEIREIQRQRDQYKAAIKELSEGRTASGFGRLDDLEWIKEVDDEHRYGAVADSYIDALKAGKSALAVAPTHAEGRRVTEAIRAQMRDADLLGQEAHRYANLTPQHLTLGQKQDPISYQEGDVLVFHQHAKGHKKGDRLVVGQDDVPYAAAERFTVYRVGEIDLSVGDRIRITKNGRSHDDKPLNNGDLYRVADFTPTGDAVVASLKDKKCPDTRVVPRDYGHLTHGFVTTSHAAQGKTVDRVLIAQSSASSAASSPEQWYVSTSRGRDQVTIFTDDKDELLRAVSAYQDRFTATELAATAVREHVIRKEVVKDRSADPTVSAVQPREPEFDHAR